MQRRQLFASAMALALTARVNAQTLVGSARQLVATPADLRQVLSQLAPGTDVLLAPGDYRQGLVLRDVRGTPMQPIRFLALDALQPPKFYARPERNTCSLTRCAYLHIVGLQFDGLGLVGSDAIKLEGEAGNWGHDILIEGCLMLGHGGSQQTVAINTKAPAWGWTIRANTILGAGTGMYFGSAQGEWPLVGATIVNNTVLDPVGYCIQIKHQTHRPKTTEFPLVPATYFNQVHQTVLKGNVLSKAHSELSKTEGWRPNLLIGHLPLQGDGAQDRYLVHSNFFHDNSQEMLFQAEGRFALYNNLFANSLGGAIAIQPHNDVPLDFVILHNTVFAHDAGIRIRTSALRPPQRAVVAGNFVCAAMPYRGETRGSLVVRARGYRQWPIRAGDALVAPSEVLEAAEDTAHWMSELPEALFDFQGKPRVRFTAGAFEQPALAIVPALKR
jgi:hypothetical protein